MDSKIEHDIIERTHEAQARMRTQNVLQRVASYSGMKVANGWDHVRSVVTGERSVFMGAGFAGLIRGGVYGALAAVAFGTLGMLGGSFLAPFLLIAVGAAIFGIKDSQEGVEAHTHDATKTFSKSTAEITGAVDNPNPNKDKALSAEESLRKNGINPYLPPEAKPALPADGFVATEKARRGQPALQGQTR